MKRLSIIFLLLVSCSPCPSYAELDNSASGKEAVFLRCLLGEAESEKNMTATAEAMRNRVALMGFKRGLRGVYGCKAVKESKGVYKRGARVIPDWAVKRAYRAWEASKGSNYTRGGTHWEAVETFGKPNWAYKLTKTAKVGQHTFYK